ncbi:MAG TPA: MBL fold metallo-hydrolase [Syntrophorhabdaceae bacterium]|nr:MBL fold metallo-hydrolase [Syntrophorhabdaceae bacterium]
MKIRFLGAARRVTGSCYHLTSGDTQILVDCGIYQGKDADEINSRSFEFDPGKIRYLLLTHAHLDHSGLIPKLVKDGFKGRILTTSATAELAEVMLYDSAHIQEKDAEWLTKKLMRTGKDAVIEPLYTTEDVAHCLGFFDKKNYETIENLNDTIRYRFIDAGHILGSGTLELWYKDSEKEKKIVFSGDIGKNGNPIIKDPEHVTEADYVLTESTYGNRFHKSLDESIEELQQAVKETFRKGGNVLIPAFAVGRTQDILYILNLLVKEGKLHDLDVYVDSPLADKATKIYMAHPEFFDAEALSLFKFKSTEGMKLHFTTTVEESQKINKIKSGAIIIAGSGMCEGGRIRHHFKHNIWRPECSVVFTGYQAAGTLGRHIIDGARHAHILGEDMAIRAKIYTIGGFSAHADQAELIEWLSTFTNKPEVFIVHGEESTALEFEKIVHEKLGLSTYVPHLGEELEI